MRTMASCKVNWILPILALVSSVLIGTVASNLDDVSIIKVPTTIDELERMLEPVWSPKNIETLLDEYENKEDKLGCRTIGELNEICRPSLDKCSVAGLKFISDQSRCYYRDDNGLAKLYEYGKYCRYAKLKEYCLENINAAVENSLKNVTTEDDELVGAFRKSLLDARVIGTAHVVDNALREADERAKAAGQKAVEAAKAEKGPFDSAYRFNELEQFRNKAYMKIYDEAYGKISGLIPAIDKAIADALLKEVCRLYGSDASLEQQELFLYKFTRAANKYRDIYLYVKEVSGDESGAKLDKGARRDAFKFGRIAARLYQFVGEELFDKLQEKLNKEYSQFDNRVWSEFLSQPEEELRKFREQRGKTVKWSLVKATGVASLFGRDNVCN